MNIEHLKLFVRLASTHNISQAGQELGLSPPVASIHIGKLEESLGARLVHRTTRKVSLTEEGMAFLPHAKQILLSVEAGVASVGTGNELPKGVLRISAPSSFGRMHVMPALKGFLAKYPDLSVDISLSDSIVDLVDGGFDVAIRNAELQNSSLIARKLSTDKRILCASPEGDVTIKKKGAIRVDHGEAVRDVCVDGLGIAMCATWIAYKQLAEGSLVEVLPDYPLKDEAAIWAVYPSAQLLAPKVRVFIDYFVQYYGSPSYWDCEVNGQTQ
ncbi:LysR family transcriptional regulator [Vibrio splendidus]